MKSDDLFLPIEQDLTASEAIDRPSLTFWGDVWRRFRINKVAVGGLVILILLV